MDINGWKYYNHATIPTTMPHETPDLSVINDGSIWNLGGGGKVYLARWTTNFDCGYETSWWYCICDRPFDISKLKAKQRNVITKGWRFFDFEEINPHEKIDELYSVECAAMMSYPEKYRVIPKKEEFEKFINLLPENNHICVAVSKETKKIRGYIIFSENKFLCYFSKQKVFPEDEKLSINAVLVNGLINRYSDSLGKGFYVCDGARNVVHETHFQEYLEKYFGFRKAYCKLNIRYNLWCKLLVKFLFPIRKLLFRFDNVGIIHKVNGVLKMEEYRSKENNE